MGCSASTAASSAAQPVSLASNQATPSAAGATPRAETSGPDGATQTAAVVAASTPPSQPPQDSSSADVIATPPLADSGAAPAAKTALTSVVGAEAARPAAETPPSAAGVAQQALPGAAAAPFEAAVVAIPPLPDSGPTPSVKTAPTSVVDAETSSPAAEAPPSATAARKEAEEEPSATDTQKAGHTGITPVDYSKLAKEALKRALGGVKEADKLAETSDWDGACKKMLYAHAALRFCLAPDGKTEMDGVETLRSELEALQAKLPEAERSKLAALVRHGSASKPIWQSVGHEKPRHERDGWAEKLQAPPQLDARPRNSEVDLKILRGDTSGLDVLAEVTREGRRSLLFIVSSTFTDTNEERNLLLADVVPYLQEAGRKHKCEAQMVEMRDNP
ncbi:hypothetical protein T484DRAFT_1860515 [Baffinella frigidus]|nr:hypothetical protein T484DRAFT_1860515 [Cryptophyta sp. CCMP2293]